MKVQPHRSARRQAGNALIAVLVLAGASMAVLAGMLSRSRADTEFVARNNQLFRSQIAAEAATEKVIAAIASDYQNFGVTLANANLDSYRSTVPTSQESSHWANYSFLNEAGTAGATTVDWLPMTTNTILSVKYAGLRGYAYDLRIVSKARESSSRFNVTAQNIQNIELAMVPVFQYAIFYNGDLEFNRCAPMIVSGPVHCNASIYCDPHTSLDFMGQVTAVGRIIMDKMPINPESRGNGTTTFHTSKREKVPSLNLPLGTNNTASAVHDIIEVPPWNESASSMLGQTRFYNKADMIIIVSNSHVWTTSGRFNNFATNIPWSQATAFVKTNNTFYDDRENKTVRSVDIDVEQLRRWSNTNTFLRPILPMSDVRTLYVANYKSASASFLPAVRLINGTNLPAKGLTVATFNPLYIKGHYNVSTNGTATSPGTAVNLGTHNTTRTRPASVACDALTILSTAWSDVNSSASLSSRQAQNTTVNCAILAGNTITDAADFGGGVHNLPRYLETWSGDTFTMNTSIVSMYPAEIATAEWSLDYYSPPTRDWAYDLNFDDPNKLPPSTPEVRLLIRGTWSD